MVSKKIKSLFKIPLVIILAILVIVSVFLFYSSREPFVKPLLTSQVNSSCPYYRDFLGRVFYKNSYYPSSLFITGPVEKKVQYYWHRVKNINNNSFKIEKILSEIAVTPSSEMQKVCIASDGNNVIYNNYVFAKADVATFEVLGNFFYKDKNTVYYSNGRIIPEADPQTFELLITDKCRDSRYAKDKYRFYEGNNVIDNNRAAEIVEFCGYKE